LGDVAAIVAIVASRVFRLVRQIQRSGFDEVMTDAELSQYEWQLWVEGFGEEGQRRLKGASVLVSRCGGVGSNVALQLAAAGVGRIVLAHAGDLKPSDLNRQILMSSAGLGRSRVEQAAERLRAINPLITVETVAENIDVDNADRLVTRVDVVAGCAPLFEERLLLNEAAVRHGKPLVDCAMYELDVQLTTVIPGKTACLACLIPQKPPAWKRRFPVFGAVAGVVGCMGAMEIIKVIAGFGETLQNQLLVGDLRTMEFSKVNVKRRADCAVCAMR